MSDDAGPKKSLRWRWQFWVGLSLIVFALDLFLWVRQVQRDLPEVLPLKDKAWVIAHFELMDWTPLEGVQPLALRAILISEDDTFFQHNGLRLDEVGAAAWDDLLAGRYKRGASSITQQVVRNAFLSKDKTLSRKLREILLARQADDQVGKRRLLEDYLNLAQWGGPQERGIAWAARTYFGKSPAQLSASEGAYLAWLLPDPKHRGQAARRGELSSAARRHVRVLLKRLAREGALTDDELAALLAQPLALPGLAPAEASH